MKLEITVGKLEVQLSLRALKFGHWCVYVGRVQYWLLYIKAIPIQKVDSSLKIRGLFTKFGIADSFNIL